MTGSSRSAQPHPPRDPNRGAAAAELREAIDAGRTGDKVPGSDPATVPLGTDDEAAGTPPTPAEVSRALRQETAGPQVRPPREHMGAAWVLVAVTVLVGLVVLGFAFAGR